MATNVQELNGRRAFGLGANQDIFLAVGVLGILLVLLIPLPTFLLDLLRWSNWT